jgi:hypothetical protein
MWWSIVVQFRGEAMRDAVADPTRLLCSFDGSIHGDREAKKMAKGVGHDYIKADGPGQPRLVKTPMEPWGADELAEVEASIGYPGLIDIDEAEENEALFVAVANRWREAYRRGWPPLRRSLYEAFNETFTDEPDATVEYLVALERSGHEWRRFEVEQLDRPAQSLNGDDAKPARLAERFRLRFPRRGQALAFIAAEFMRDGVGEREATQAYREVAAHYIITTVHENYPDQLPPGLTGEDARDRTRFGMAIFDANWALEAAEEVLPTDHGVYVGGMQCALHWGELYPRAASLIRSGGWTIVEGDPGDALFLPDQVMLPEDGLLAVSRDSAEATESVRVVIAEDSVEYGMQIEITAIGGRRASDLGALLQENLAYQGNVTPFRRLDDLG